MIYQTPPTGGKTIMAKACLRDTFSDMLSANFKTATSTASQLHMSNSSIALMIAIARHQCEEFNPSAILVKWLTVGGFTYAGPLSHRDSSFLVPTLARLEGKVHWFAFDYHGASLTGEFKISDIHYLVLAFAPDTFTVVNSATNQEYPLKCLTLVPTSCAQAELRRPFAGVAGIQLFEASVIYSTGFLSRYSGERIAYLDSEGGDFAAELASTDHVTDVMQVYKDVIDLEMKFSVDDLGMPHYKGNRDADLKISSFIKSPGCVTSASLTSFGEDGKPIVSPIRCAVIEPDLFDPFEILKSDRAFLESSVGFKHLERQGLSSAAVTAGITSSFLLSLFASNESEIFMSYVPYGDIDPIGNGSFDLGGYSAGQMYVKHEGANTHPFFTKTLAAKGKCPMDTIAFTTRSLGDREKLIYLCKDDEVYGKGLVLSRNKIDPTLLGPDDFHLKVSGAMDISSVFSEWEITHGHTKLVASRKDVEVPSYDISTFKNWSVNGDAGDDKFQLPRDLTFNL